MDLSTVSNAVNDALSGLPAGTSDFINQNIGTPQGQFAIVQAGLSLGLNQAQIAAAVNQVTGMKVTPQQVAQVQQTSPIVNQAPTQQVQPKFVGSAAPGAVGTSYGQANGQQIASVQQAQPELASALQNGNASLNFDADTGTYNLINTKTSAPISGNYQVQVGQNGQIGINIPSANGSMVQVATSVGDNGQIPPVTANNVLNTGLNAGAGGFAGGISDLKPLLTQAALMYAGSQLSDLLNPATTDATNAIGNTDVGSTLSSIDTGVTSNIGNTGTLGTTDATNAIGNTGTLGSTDYSLGGTGSSGTGLNVAQGTGTQLFDTSAVNPATGLTNGLGLQQSGSTNLASMGGGQGLTIPTSTGASNVNNAVLGASGTTNYGTGNLPVNSLTGQTLGNAVNNVNTGVTTPSTAITNTSGNVTGTPVGTNTSTGIIPSTTGTTTGTNALGLTPLQTAVAGTGVLSTLGSLGVNTAISNAANTQTTAANNANDVLKGFYDQYAQAQQPYQNLGTGAVQTIEDQAPFFTHQFNAQDLQSNLAPNYEFMFNQGVGANRNLANVGGGLLSGNTLQGLNTFGQNFAGNAYQQAFNNYQTQRQNIYSNLSNAAGLGQTSLGQLGQVGSNLANTYGNITTGLAASQAGAQTAQAVNNANLLSNLAKTGTVLALA